ncbi:MAG: family 16 glycosylhydrolase [Ruminococcus sp.]|nr:family 16 glycosylhydrolase [Ruminococcus sp.]
MALSSGVKRLLSAAAAAAVACCIPFPAASADEGAEPGFYEDFSGSSLDTDKWLAAEKNWGGTVNEDGVTKDYNGGVTAENVSVSDGKLVLKGLGNRYEGNQRGINRDGSRRSDGKRCGGAVATKEYFGSGSYEIRARIAPELGCCSAMWTFEYEEDYSGDKLNIINHEIDIEFPGRDKNDDLSLSHALCTTWVTEEDYRTKSVDCGEQTDGKFHTYRFDWHTGSEDEVPRVEYYFDDKLTYTAYDFIPTNESRFWLGLWFPKYWAGTPDFEETVFEVDYVRITPFHESGDTPQHESYPDSGWKETAELPKSWLLWHSYSSYSALDSRLYLRTPDGTVKTISGDFIHAMNGSFGISPEQIIFMAIDREADEWDIYLSDGENTENLTERSGFRNEDPKWSPDGKSVVFKRGHWDNDADGFVYDLALLDIETRTVTMLTDDSAEEAMPCFSEDGSFIYYASYSGGIGSICRLDTASHRTETIFSESGVTAYYPVVRGDELFFTKWYSADNRCDQLVRYDDGRITRLPFDSELYDCSDACPADGDRMIFSSTMNGDYDLYLFDGEKVTALTEINSGNNDLGADIYTWEEYQAYLESSSPEGDVNMDGRFNIADAVLLQKWLLSVSGEERINTEAADICRDNKLDGFDLCMMRSRLIGAGSY